MKRLTSIIVLVLLVAALSTSVMANSSYKVITSPTEYYGYPIGSDRQLPDWYEMVEYFKLLAQESDRVVFEELGKTTDGLPFINMIISSEDNIEHLAMYKAINARLADPRGLSDNEIDALMDKGKTIVLITNSVHSTEVGGTQFSIRLAYELAAGLNPRAEEILENVILILVPSLNPDGHQMCVDWYRKYLGTQYEGASTPWLYQRYVGHDNNRDWYTIFQQESKLLVNKVHNVWHPQIVWDTHQMGSSAARIFIPPYLDPIEPNVDPIIVANINDIGTAMAAELYSMGKTGIVINAIYDAWTPARAYQHYHAGVRILTEVASANFASPVEVEFSKQGTGIGYDAKVASWKLPEPFAGGTWTLGDIVEYETIAGYGLLSHAARNRDRWLKSFVTIGLKAVNNKEGPNAIVIPADQIDPITAKKFMDILDTAMVEMWVADAPFTVGGRTFPKYSVVIKREQPYFAFAKAISENQDYPEIYQYPGGPLQRPYDVTAHTLPLLMGVETVFINEPLQSTVRLLKLEEGYQQVFKLTTAQKGSKFFLIEPHQNAGFQIANEMLAAKLTIGRSTKAFEVDGNKMPAGTWVIPQQSGISAVIDKWVEKGLRFVATNSAVEYTAMKAVRTAMYYSWSGSAEEGWLRFSLEKWYELPFTSIFDADIKAGNLNDKFDVIIVSSYSENVMNSGLNVSRYPMEYSGGLGDAGKAALKSFVENGGTLLTLQSSSLWAINLFGLPLKNATSGLKADEYYVPGSILAAEFDVNQPVAWGMDANNPIWFSSAPAFTATGGTTIAKLPTEKPLISGWANDVNNVLSSKVILWEGSVGKGKVIVTGPTFSYRNQSQDMHKIILNTMFNAGLGK